MATHLDTDHLHSHFIVNSVQPDTGRKLHFTPRTLENMRMVSDQICREHGLSTLKPYRQERGEKGIKTGEYRAAVRGESWKFQLITTVEAVMERVGSRRTSSGKCGGEATMCDGRMEERVSPTPRPQE